MLIFYFSSQPSLPSAQKIWWDFTLKKSAHMIEYAVLFFLLIRAMPQKTPRTYLIATLICLTYAITDELHQGFTPGRHPHIFDIYYDSLGITGAYLKTNSFI